jgi:hypothetical protein
VGRRGQFKDKDLDGTTWIWWRYREDGAVDITTGEATGQFPENLSHAGFTFAALLLV